MVLYICTQDIKSLLINSFHTYSFQITSRQKFILPFSKLLDTNIYTDILYIKVALFCNHLILPWYGFVLTWSISDLHTNLSYCIETLLQFAHMHSNPDLYLFVLTSASPDHCTHRHLLSSHVLFFLNNSWTQIIKTSSYLRLTSSCVSSSCLRAYCSSPHNFTQFAKQNYKLLLESLWSPKFCLSHVFLPQSQISELVSCSTVAYSELVQKGWYFRMSLSLIFLHVCLFVLTYNCDFNMINIEALTLPKSDFHHLQTTAANTYGCLHVVRSSSPW